MEFSIKSGDPTKQRTACLVLGVYSHRRLSPIAQQVDKAGKGYLTKILKRGDMNGESGEQVMLYDVPGSLAERVLLIGLGKAREFTLKQYRKTLSSTVKSLDKSHSAEAVCCLSDLELQDGNLYQTVRDTVISAEDALYRVYRAEK
ncbi:M17 family peptidase N-terminal domain-containing protein [endosymbiont of Lamellibrachia barhami]|uniref:M17 family peptidase N-terminal domain-containing protein n=1 Tax=endosymbiont of Lamellibrachia barhami TaxID=205975 RepID=UPI0015B339F2|nr:M17 family peptidase N-terminal domain-containing protein [endosymbiont of Lamellibrachia barhami]